MIRLEVVMIPCGRSDCVALMGALRERQTVYDLEKQLFILGLVCDLGHINLSLFETHPPARN